MEARISFRYFLRKTQNLISGWFLKNWVRNSLTWVLIGNVHFWNYYVTSFTYVRKPFFNHSDSTFFTKLFLASLLNSLLETPHNLHFSFLRKVKQTKRKDVAPIRALCFPPPSFPHDIATPPPPTYNTPR